LKKVYGREIEYFVRAYINYITKVEFFLAFKAAYFTAIIESNNKGGFRGVSLVPFDPEAIISKLDIKLRTLTPTSPPSVATDL
jgi:hypothetical protein